MSEVTHWNAAVSAGPAGQALAGAQRAHAVPRAEVQVVTGVYGVHRVRQTHLAALRRTYRHKLAVSRYPA